MWWMAVWDAWEGPCCGAGASTVMPVQQAAFLAIRVCVCGAVWCGVSGFSLSLGLSLSLCAPLACLVKISMSDVPLLSCV